MAIKHTLLSLVSIAAAGFLLTACASDKNNLNQSSITAVSTHAASKAQITQQKPAKSYLFVVSSGAAQMKQLTHHRYQLTMNLPSIDQVVAYTDRPYYDAHFMTAKELQSLWSKGKNSFAKDHPNAVLSSKNVWPTIVEVESVTASHDQIHVTFMPLSQKLPAITHLDKVTLTVDGVYLSNTTTTGGLESVNANT